MDIIIKGGRTHKPHEMGEKSKDELHKRRKQLAQDIRSTTFSKDQLNWRDCPDKDSQNKRVKDYDKWKEKNESKMREWSNINREFKKRGEEGRLHSVDDLRRRKSEKYD